MGFKRKSLTEKRRMIEEAVSNHLGTESFQSAAIAILLKKVETEAPGSRISRALRRRVAELLKIEKTQNRH